MTVTMTPRKKIFAALATRQHKEATDLIDRYRALVVASVDGREVDPDEVLALLYECGKTVQDLDADCDHLEERRRLVAELGAARQVADTMNALQSQQSRNLEQQEAEYRCWREKWDRIGLELREQIRKADLAQTQTTLLSERLQKNAWPDMQDRLAEIKARRAPIFAKWQSAYDRLVQGDSPHARQIMAETQPLLDELTAEETALRQEMVDAA